MACLITLNGITLDCQPSLGGIKKVWLTQYSDVSEVTVDPESKMISDITNAGEWYEYQFRKATGSLTSTLNVDETAGINYVSNELSLVFTKMETAKRIEIAALSIGQLCAIVLDSNGHYWFLGIDDYVSASAGAGNTGTAKGDQNAYTLTLSTDSDSYPYEIDPSKIETILA
jgi:hypothetical protein